MKMKERQFTLKNGDTVTLKSVAENEADAVLDFMKEVYSETNFLALTPEEVKQISVKNEREVIAEYERDKRGIFIAAYAKRKIVAACCVKAYEKMKENHRANFALAVKQEYGGNGLGTELLGTAIDFAKKAGYDQIECDTDADNVTAMVLYQKFGLIAICKFPHAAKLADGKYCDYIRFVKNFKDEA